jgi:polyphosphate kinase
MIHKKTDERPYLERDLSWLDFNYRVLQEARDTRNAILDRLKFIAIFSSNRDEFFRVRVAHHRNMIRLGKKEKKVIDYDSKLIMREIMKQVNKQQIELNDIFINHIIPAMKKFGINILRRLELKPAHIEFIETYFRDHMLPFVQPVMLVGNKVKPFLNNSALYLALDMRDPETKEPQFGIVKIPSDHLPRFIELPSSPGVHDVIFIDDIVRHSIPWLFPGYEILDTYSIKLTRDAELYIDDEYSGDLTEKIRQSLIKRNIGPASRLVYDNSMPAYLLNYLKVVFELQKVDLFPEGRYHNKSDFFYFPDFGIKSVRGNTLPPIEYKRLLIDDIFYEELRKQDHLLYFPFNGYEPVVNFFERAARDPDVTHIKLIQYRVASESRIMDHLLEAAQNGKQVSVFIEIKARFDEEANLEWGEKLKRHGIEVHYSIPGIKVHSKLALIRRLEDDKARFYAYLSTGNFHEQTAKIYTDFGLFTADERYTSEIMRVFNYIENGQKPRKPFKTLLIGKFNLRSSLVDLVKNEIEIAKNGGVAKIFLKLNSLQDKQMIDLLYEASEAGVEIRLIIRGISSLLPGIPGVSENIHAISIVDSYLEHARVYTFYNEGNEKVYLSSADWMERNLSYRIETAFEILDPALKEDIHKLMTIQWNDNTKARYIHFKNTNKYITHDNDFPNRSQIECYYFIKRKEEILLNQESILNG